MGYGMVGRAFLRGRLWLGGFFRQGKPPLAIQQQLRAVTTQLPTVGAQPLMGGRQRQRLRTKRRLVAVVSGHPMPKMALYKRRKRLAVLFGSICRQWSQWWIAKQWARSAPPPIDRIVLRVRNTAPLAPMQSPPPPQALCDRLVSVERPHSQPGEALGWRTHRRSPGPHPSGRRTRAQPPAGHRPRWGLDIGSPSPAPFESNVRVRATAGAVSATFGPATSCL